MPDPVAAYFQTVMEDVETYAVNALDRRKVVEETRAHGSAPTAALIVLTGPVLDGVFRLLVSRMISIMTEGQHEAIMQAAATIASGTGAEADQEAYREQFLAEARPLLDRLNDEAAEAVRDTMQDAFPHLASHTAAFIAVDGETFEDRVRSLPHGEAEEHINALTAYIDSIRDAVEGCDHVTVSIAPPGIPASWVQLHVRSELLRVLQGAERVVEQRIAETVGAASTGA